MDTAIRDLEQIREQDGDGWTRRTGTWVMGSLALAAVVFITGLLAGGSGGEQVLAQQRDSLAQLDLAAQLADVSPEGKLDQAPEPVEIDKGDLTFPSTLTASAEHPAQAARVMAAAGAEHAHPEPLVPSAESASAPVVHTAPSPPAATNTVTLSASTGEDGVAAAGDTNEIAANPAITDVARSLPAAVTATEAGHNLVQAAPRDALVAASIPKPVAGAVEAPAGREGRYTLQVISYRSRSEAETFAEGLRAKGHQAFIVSADIKDRGRYYRVRIGPFEKLREVEAYRADFERDERMNTFIVQRREE